MLTDKCKPKQNCEAYKELQAKCECLEKKLLAMQNEWVSVKDKLPMREQEVLVCFKDGFGQTRIGTGQPIDSDGWSGHFWGEITHWMLLPQLPEDE